MRKVRVLVIEDSAVVRELLTAIIGSDPRLEVAAAVESAEEALAILDRTAPDVISLDMRLPGMDGFEAVSRIMAERPTPIVVVSASVDDEELKISMNALRAGALAVVEKPVGVTRVNYEALAEQLCTQFVIMSSVLVVRQRYPRAVVHERIAPRPSAAPSARVICRDSFNIVAVVTSTGGPKALVTMLNDLGAEFPLPILIVQHIMPHFHSGFVSWLDGMCPLRVVAARQGEVPAAGTVYVAPPEHHLLLQAGRLSLDGGPPVSGQRPSGTVLFRSLAASLGPRAVGALLTGMGDDGALGLLEMSRAGGYTIAEDETTAVVHGMPGAAIGLGAACEVLPLPRIGLRLWELVREEGRIR